MSPLDRKSRRYEAHEYEALASAALQHYTLGPTTITFIQHNAGVVFRVDASSTHRSYMLKLHDRVGDGENPDAAELEAGMRWLSDLARDTGMALQVPMLNAAGCYVSQIIRRDGAIVINCTLQTWLEGEPPHGHFTMAQVRQIGELMARLHLHVERYAIPQRVPARHHDTLALRQGVDTLRMTLVPGIVAPHEFAMIEVATERIAAVMEVLGKTPSVWGPVHGDIHHDNLLFYGENIRLIDFTGLRLAHYCYDIGVTLYHIFYQEPAIRHAFLDGYTRVRGLPDHHISYAEAFLTYAAIDNVAWNSTIEGQLSAPLFRKNVDWLINSFCAPLAAGRSFLFAP